MTLVLQIHCKYTYNFKHAKVYVNFFTKRSHESELAKFIENQYKNTCSVDVWKFIEIKM